MTQHQQKPQPQQQVPATGGQGPGPTAPASSSARQPQGLQQPQPATGGAGDSPRSAEETLALRQGYVKQFKSSKVYTAMLKRQSYRIHDDGFELPQPPDCFSLSKREWEDAACRWRNEVKGLAGLPTKTPPKETKALKEAHAKASKAAQAAKAIVFAKKKASHDIVRYRARFTASRAEADHMHMSASGGIAWDTST